MTLAAVDRLAALIAENLPSDAVLAVTGDHGMMTVDRKVDIDETPVLTRGVDLVGGDARARLVYDGFDAACSEPSRLTILQPATPATGKLFVLDGLGLNWRSIRVPKDSQCKTCGERDAPTS